MSTLTGTTPDAADLHATAPRDGASLGAALRLSATAAATTWAAMLSWSGFTDIASRFLLPLVLIGVVVAGLGALGRFRRVPGAVVLVGQAVGGFMAACLVIGDRPYPTSAFWTAVDDAFTAAQTYAAPVPSTADVSIHPLLLLGGLTAMLLVDLLACTLRRVALAGLPLITVYSVPVSLLDDGLRWWVFVLTAIGFLTLLFLHEEEQVGRWGRSLDPAASAAHRSEAVRGGALLVGVAATAAAVVAPLVIPTFDIEVLDLGPGPGGNDQITIENPLTDLRRDLRRGRDIPLVEVVTDDPSPDHLRISVLNRFSDNEFSSGDRDVPSDNLASGQLPPLQGLSDAVAANAEQFDYRVTIAPEFDSRWLPTQAPVSTIDAPGDWRFDESTMDFLASEDDLTTAGLSYEMTSVEYDFRPADLRSTPRSGDEVSPEVTALPERTPAIVGQLARGVTAGQRTDYEKAVALQQWFREDGGFVYSLEDAPTAKVGTDELEAFLREDTGRVGYCEQFATAMTVMARTLDIPSRVAVGFLTPDRTAPDTYVYSAHDLHAWTEIYLPGAGWVLFDPTPGDRVPDRRLPDYTTRGTDTVIPTARPDEEPSRQPSGQPSVDAESPTTAPDPAEQAGSDASDDAGLPWGRMLLLLGVLALLALLAVAPHLLRSRQRAGRLGAGPEAAWDELRATTIDLGEAWPEHRSPREALTVLLSRLGRAGDDDERPARGPARAPQAAQALARLVLALEQSRYGFGSRAPAGAFDADVESCRTALLAGATRRTRRRAVWLPRSVVRRSTVTAERGDGPVAEDRSGELVEHV